MRIVSVYDMFMVFGIVSEAYTEFFGGVISCEEHRKTCNKIKRGEVPLWIHSWMRQHKLKFTWGKV